MTYGFNGHIGLARETTWGTAVGATDYFEALSESLVPTIARFDTRNIIAAFSRPKDSAGLRSYEGEVNFAGFPDALGFFLAGALGVNSVSSIGGGLFQNRMTTRLSDFGSLSALPPYTFEIFRDITSSQQFKGVQIAGLDIVMAPNAPVNITARVIAKSMVNIAKTTPTFPTSPNEPFLFDTVSLSLPAGTGRPDIEGLTVSIDNQLEGISALNATNEVAKIRRSGPQIIGVRGTLEFINITDFLAFTNQDEQRLLVNVTRANSFSMLIDVPQMVFTSMPLQMSGAERVTADFEAQGQFHVGSAQSIRIDLTTTQTYSVA